MQKTLKHFGKYFLLDRLATGGMAEIYRAFFVPDQDPAHRRLVAIKLLKEDLTDQTRFQKMFQTEIRVTLGLNHPNIAMIYDFGDEEESPFLAMEYVHGKSLRQILTALKKQQSPPRAVGIPLPFLAAIFERVADGLQYAHKFADPHSKQKLGIIHRDISPQNILIGFDGTVKIIDFGIAKAAALKEITETGVIKGTPSYLSPEQVTGEIPLDHRTDLFSMGSVLWECATGKRLFEGESPRSTLALIENSRNKIPPPSSVDPQFPMQLGAVITKLLEYDPQDRFLSGGEFRDRFLSTLKTLNPAVNPATKSEMRSFMENLFSEKAKAETLELELIEQEGHEILDKEQLSIKEKSPEEISIELEQEDIATHEERISRTYVHENPPIAAHPPPPDSGRGLGMGIAFVVLAATAGLIGLQLSKRGNSPEIIEKDQTAQTVTQDRPASPAGVPAGKVGFFIETNPPTRVTLIVDGKYIKSTPPKTLAYADPGKPIEIEIHKKGFRSIHKAFSLDDLPLDQNREGQSFKSLRETLELVEYGLLSVDADVSAIATMDLDGAPWTRQTPLKEEKIPIGRYVLKIENSTLGRAKSVTLEVKSGKHIQIRASLISPKKR